MTSYEDLPSQEAALGVLIARGEHVVLSLGPPGRADLRALAVVARLVLGARRGSAGHLRVRAERGLLGLAGLCGLADVLDVDVHPVAATDPPGGAAGPCRSGQARRQLQPGEQLGAEEVVDVGDPPA